MGTSFKRIAAHSLLLASAAAFGCDADVGQYDEIYEGETEGETEAEVEAWYDEDLDEDYQIENFVEAPFDGLGPGLRSAKLPPKSYDGVGAFRIHQCDVSHYRTDDPIVYPGKFGASHDHMFFGNMTTRANSNQNSLSKGATTCPGGKRNLSAYWIPTMLDASGKRKHPNAIRVYYKGGYAVNQSSIKAPPTGLRMVAGWNLRNGGKKGAQFRGCALNNGNNKNMDGCKKGQTLQLWLSFPQCWNGKQLDSADHMSHMAYTRSGKCPSSHPVPIPEITYVVSYKVDTNNGTKSWRLASDMGSDYGGQSAHGDWWNAWEPSTLKAFIAGCIHAKRDCNNGNLGNGWQLVMP